MRLRLRRQRMSSPGSQLMEIPQPPSSPRLLRPTVSSLKPMMDILKRGISKKNPGARSGAIVAIVTLTNESLEGQTEPYIIPLIVNLLELQADKQAKTKERAILKMKNVDFPVSWFWQEAAYRYLHAVFSCVDRSSADSTWISRQKLEDMGFGKKVAEAAKMGLNRPLTAKEIEKNLNKVGLEPEFATHSRIRGLSGGQKVKLVIGAAMWNKPHMLVLDEPINYLDRESLGALAMAIKEYSGGGVIVTHNREFTEALCNEVWVMDVGRLTPSGHNWVSGNCTTTVKEEEQEDQVDAQGNTVKAVQKKKKERIERRKRGEEVYTTDEEL